MTAKTGKSRRASGASAPEASRVAEPARYTLARAHRHRDRSYAPGDTLTLTRAEADTIRRYAGADIFVVAD